ncbi:hypothetical protein Hanom_Chr09g00870241 [Helianthus anomalus]
MNMVIKVNNLKKMSKNTSMLINLSGIEINPSGVETSLNTFKSNTTTRDKMFLHNFLTQLTNFKQHQLKKSKHQENMAKAQRYRERKLFGCNRYDSLLRIIFSEADDHKILREKNHSKLS